MDRKQLQNILTSPFVYQDWKDVLASVFGVKRLHQQPQQIPLPTNDKADLVFELGSFNTADDMIVGIYQVNVKPEVWLERNKVGLRELLRNVYKYEVDGALIVFVQENKWRLSFVSEIRTLDEEGSIKKIATEPKRYTYLLGEGEKTKTPVSRLFALTGKPISLEDIRTAFSVEALNEEFYKIIAEQFYQLVGATAGKGKKQITYDRMLQLPGVTENNGKIYQEFAVRLIGRTVFCWFLKVKKSNEGIALLPEHLLSSEAVKTHKNYYHTILERLFFQTLNTPMDQRIDGLPTGCEQIPFLNGGLFESQAEDFYKESLYTGLSEFLNTLIIPNEWFLTFFEKLEQYNFTIDENSVVDIEVSVDPEMLGRIFENLLAEIDPDSGETARKATGSFYTPREIVDYMATESLTYYLNSKTLIEKERLLSLFKMDRDIDFTTIEIESLLEALDTLKVLDPACGSGAFPMGVLQKIVMALQKLDPEVEWWKKRQINRIDNALLRNQIKEKLNHAGVEYTRKIGIIQNTLFGVDIQPIAAEISKLRCFLTLIVDENIDEAKPNRGVEPLPNLEFKFVTADSLLKLPDEKNFGGLFNANEDLEQLQQLRLDYLQSFGVQKLEIKDKFRRLQKVIFKQQLSFGAKEDSRAYQISTWNPFCNEKSNWFDPLWMFGVEAFDIVIGNPPYGAKLEKELIEKYKSIYSLKSSESAILFIERGYELILKGIECYIIPKSFSFASNYGATRDFVNDELALLGDCGKAFDQVKLEACVILIEKGKRREHYLSVKFNSDKTFNTISEINKSLKETFNFLPNGISQNEIETGLKIRLDRKTLNDISTNSRGEMVQKFINDNGDWKVIGGKEIDKYGVRGVKGYLSTSAIVGNKGKIRDNSVLVQNIIAHLTNPVDHIKIIACIPNDKSILIADTINQISINHSEYSKQFIWAILNSKLINWYCYRFIFGKAIRTMHFDNSVTSRIPIPSLLTGNQKPFQILVDYILFIKELNKENTINEYVSNSHIVQLFEEVIDAMVYELYFKNNFEEMEIEFIRYGERDFMPIEGLNEYEKIKIIHESHQKLREKDNEIRNNMLLMKIELRDLLMPIISI